LQEAVDGKAAREINQWFFERYVPAWETLGRDGLRDPKEILNYWSVPMCVVSERVNKWLLTEEAVLDLLRVNHEPLRASGYTHTNIIDRRTIVYNENAASVDAIWSRCREDNTEVERVAVHFEINRADNGWRITGLASASTAKSFLDEAWLHS
jgi:hypothetical protein